MLVINLPFENLPQAKLTDKVYQVLQLMSEYHVQELVVSQGDEFLGLIKEEILQNADEELTVETFQQQFIKISVGVGDHLLKAVAITVAAHLSILPVTDTDNKLIGILETRQLLVGMASFMHVNEPGALIVLEVDPLQYSFSEICRLVESNDAQITQLNSSRNSETGNMQVTIKVNKVEISDIVATFQRYDYHVIYYFGEELYANELKSNYENLMSYLNV